MSHEDDFCRPSAWQATFPSLALNLADKWQKSSEVSCQQPPKKFTIEAVFVMCVILFFVMLCVIGSLINAYESFRKALLRKKTLRKLKDQKKDANEETQAERKIKPDESSNISVWRENCRNFIDCFSVQANARKILGDVSKQEYMDFIDGIRTIVFLYIFTIHFFFIYFLSSKNLQKNIHAVLAMPLTQFAVNAHFGIVAFIVLSGFLNGYLFSIHLEKNNGKVPWVPFYAFRILRLTPMYMALLGFYSTLFTYMSSSPIWPTYDTNPVCKENWIWNLLYINNYNSHWNQCMSMSWTLACLMQLYLISPLFMIPLNRSLRVGYVLSAVAICISCYLSFIITKQYNLPGVIPRQFDGLDDLYSRLWQYVDKIHQNPFVKLTPYLIGILLGCHLNNRKLIQKNSWSTLTFGWISSAVLMYFSFFALHGREESVWEEAVYNGVKELIFACGFSWLIFVCATRQGAFLGKFLSHKIFKPISRLSFSGYLTQTIVLEGHFLSVKVFVDDSIISKGLLSDLSWVVLFIRLLLWTLVSAFVVSLLFESPVIKLLNIYFIANKNKRL